MAKQKTCSKCKVSKPLSEFYKNRRHNDGLQTYCKPCACTQGRDWRAANPERERAAQAIRTARKIQKRREALEAAQYRS